jgi:hypothetical protein
MTTNINPVPQKITPLSPNGFMFSIQKLPEVSYFCQNVDLPGITLGTPDFTNPFASIPIPGDHLTYDTLNIRFQIDEQMINYKAIYNWIIALGFPQNYQQYINLLNSAQVASLSELAKNSSDGTLLILDHANNVTQTVKYHDMFPISIETVGFESTNTDVPYIVGSATFKFSYYEFA